MVFEQYTRTTILILAQIHTMKILFSFIFGFIIFFQLTAQKLESVIYLESFQKEEIGALLGISVNYDVDIFKVKYYTPDINGNEHLASGIICIPLSDTEVFPLACYQHGTVGSRDDVPSNLQGGYILAVVFASYGYVVTTPDYLGLGDSPGIHPYVHAATEASAAIDLLYAARELDRDDDTFSMSDQLFITGYSQGGHASMAAQQVIEHDFSHDFSVTAAAHMSGPYSISEKMIEFTLGENEYFTPSYIAATMLGYKEAYPNLLANIEIQDVFKSQYLVDVNAYANEDISLWDLNDRFVQDLMTENGVVRPRDLIKEDILDEILNDPDSPIFNVFKDNDTYDWAPTAPTRLFYCEGDDVVKYQNAILAETVMNANGAADVLAVKSDDFVLLDHTACVLPASFSSILFFGNYQNVMTSLADLTEDSELTINNNNELLQINISSETYRINNKLLIRDMNGRLILSTTLDNGKSYYNIANLPKGMYIIHVIHKDKLLKTRRIVKF